MKEPLLADFGATTQDETALKKFENSLSSFVAIVAVAGPIIVVALSIAADAKSVPDAIFGAFIGGIFTFAGAVFCGLFFYVAVTSIVTLGIARFRRVGRYQRALRQFNEWLLRTRTEFWLSLTARQFELELAGLYRRLGYEAVCTPSSGDKGIDIILTKSGVVTVVQCESGKMPAGPAVARELYGAMMACGAKHAVLASLNGCTSGTREFIENKPITVVSLSHILEMQKKCDAVSHSFAG